MQGYRPVHARSSHKRAVRDILSMLVRLASRPRGMRNAPRGGDKFATGPTPIWPEPHPSSYPYAPRQAPETRADLVALSRPYLRERVP